MFTVSMKIKRKKLIVCSAFIALVLIAGSAILLVSGNDCMYKDRPAVSVKKAVLNDNGSRVEFLKSFGWNVSDEPIEVAQVQIPSELDDVFTKYNEIQKAQGMDLEKYLGKRAVRYTYSVNNYPEHPKYIRANMLIYKDKVIAGDVCSVEIDGFMHGFRAPEDIEKHT